MNYPSLMFLGDKTGVTVRKDLFDDLKINLLVSDEVIDSMLDVCTKEDILARQEMFRALENDRSRDEIGGLSEDIDEVYRLYETYVNAESDNERNVIFVSLMKAVVKFTGDAAKFHAEGKFFERFHAFFEEESRREEYNKLTEDINAVYPSLDEISRNTYKVENDNIRLTTAVGESYESRLIVCANNLGLPAFQPPRKFERPLSSAIIEAVSLMYPDEFKKFKDFYDKHNSFFDEDILRYFGELAFYIELSELFANIHEMGIPITYPSVSDEKKVDVREAYDVSLLAKNESNIVPNDITFSKEEPFYYLTGANGGGKTTYLRAVGAVITFFLNGCPIPCRSASIYPFKKIMTHFPRDERFDSGGRFQNENALVNEILEEQDGDSIILLNETYSATSEELAVPLTVELAETLYKSGSFGIYITHQHGVGETEIPFLNVVVDLNDSNRRTFKIARQQGSLGSMALDILKKYQLDRDALAARFGGVR